jgi:hypothetical protein
LKDLRSQEVKSLRARANDEGGGGATAQEQECRMS